MELLTTYKDLQTKKITLEQAAETIGIEPMVLERRLKRLGKEANHLFDTLDKIRTEKITRSEAAKILDTSPRNVNLLMVRWNVERESRGAIKDYLIEREAPKIKWEIRKSSAVEFIADACTIEEAAERAGVTTRQIRRWVSELLDKHFGMVFKDLKPLTLRRRQRLADEIEKAEGLELAKKEVLERIIRGERELSIEAYARISARHTQRRENNVSL